MITTERFKDVSAAEKEGYALQFGCVSGADSGAMGLHYINGSLVGVSTAEKRHISLRFGRRMGNLPSSTWN